MSNTNKYVINGNGFVTLLNSTPSWIDLFGPNINDFGVIYVTFNIFSGLGVAIETFSQRILYFDIDFGGYSLEGFDGIPIVSGTDARLAEYGSAFPINDGSEIAVGGGIEDSGRGELYWNWYQTVQRNLYNITMQPWPSLLEAQYTKYLTL